MRCSVQMQVCNAMQVPLWNPKNVTHPHAPPPPHTHTALPAPHWGQRECNNITDMSSHHLTISPFPLSPMWGRRSCVCVCACVCMCGGWGCMWCVTFLGYIVDRSSLTRALRSCAQVQSPRRFDHRHRCELINTALIRHDRIPTVRTSCGLP